MSKKVIKKKVKKVVKREPSRKQIIEKFTKGLIDIANEKRAGLITLSFKEKDGITFSSIACDMTIRDVHSVINQLIEICHPELKEIADMIGGFNKQMKKK